jgi:hypothetical protein
MLEEVDSIDELKAAVEKPIAFLDRVSKAGAENLGITTSAGLLVLEVVPDGQGAQKGVQVGNLISHVGSTSLSNCNGSDSESTRMDIKFGSLLSEARTAEVACVTIKFNGGTKKAEFKMKSQPVEPGNPAITRQKTRRGGGGGAPSAPAENLAVHVVKEKLRARSERQYLNPALREENRRPSAGTGARASLSAPGCCRRGLKHRQLKVHPTPAVGPITSGKPD